MADTNNAKVGKSKFSIMKFFKEVKAELKKVTWPNRAQVVHNTGIILAFIIIICIILSLLDLGFGELRQLLIP